jgi:hypothetical protein
MTKKNMLILIVFWVATTMMIAVQAQNSSTWSADEKAGQEASWDLQNRSRHLQRE